MNKYRQEGTGQVNKIRKTLMGWKPLMYSIASLATLVMAAGAKWRPH